MTDILLDDSTGLPPLPENFFWKVSKGYIYFNDSYYGLYYFINCVDGIIKGFKDNTHDNVAYVVQICEKSLVTRAVPETHTYGKNIFSGQLYIKETFPGKPAEYTEIIKYTSLMATHEIINKDIFKTLNSRDVDVYHELIELGHTPKLFTLSELNSDSIKETAIEMYHKFIDVLKEEKENEIKQEQIKKVEEKYLGNYPPKGL